VDSIVVQRFIIADPDEGTIIGLDIRGTQVPGGKDLALQAVDGRDFGNHGDYDDCLRVRGEGEAPAEPHDVRR
jgi:hypothetical protein